MADASTTRGVLAYGSLITAIAIPLAQKHGVTITADEIVDTLVAASLAWHGICTFIESRWPAKTPITDDAVTQITRNVLAEMRANPSPFLVKPTQEQSK